MADDNELLLKIASDVQQAVADMRRMTDALTGAGAAARQAGGEWSSLSKSIITVNQAANLSITLWHAVANAVKSVIGPAMDTERQHKLLEATLRSTNQFVPGYAKNLIDLAASLEKVTRFSANETLAVERQLVQYKAAQKDIPRLTELILDLATSMGVDLHTAGFAVAKMIQGNFSPVMRLLGVRMEEGASSGEKLTKVMTALGDRAGAARRDAETFGGSLAQIRNQADNLATELGNVFVKSDALKKVFADVRDRLIQLAEKTKAWVEANRPLIDNEIDLFFTNLSAGVNLLPDRLGRAATAAERLWSAIRPFAEFVTAHPQATAVLLGAGAGARIGGAFGPSGRIAGAVIGAAIGSGGDPQWQEWQRQLRPDAGGIVRTSGDAAWPSPLSAHALGAGGSSNLPASLNDRWLPTIQDAGGDAARAQKSALGAAAAQVTFQQAAVGVLQAGLQFAEMMKRTNAEVLSLARQLDTAQIALLEKQRSAVLAELKKKGLTEGELADINAQAEALTTQIDLVRTMTGEEIRRKQAIDEQRLATEKQVAALESQAFGTETQQRIFGLQQAQAELIKQLTERGGMEDAIARVNNAYGKMISDAQAGTIDLGATIRSSLTDAFQGVVLGTRDGKTWSEKFAQIGDAFQTSVVGKFTDAFAEILQDKLGFDQKLHLNFTQDVPESAGAGATGMLKPFASAFKWLRTGSATPASITVGPGGTIGGADAFPQSGGFSSAQGPMSMEAGSSAFGTLGGGGGGASSGFTAAEGTAQGSSGALATSIVGIFIAGATAIMKGLAAARAESRRFGATDESVAGAAVGSLPIIGELVNLVGQENAGKFMRGPGGAIVDPLGFLLTRYAMQAPTRGTQYKKELSKALEDTQIPRQHTIEAGGRSGVRTPFFELPLTPAWRDVFSGYSGETLNLQDRKKLIPGAQALMPASGSFLSAASIFALQGGQFNPKAGDDTRTVGATLVSDFAAMGVGAKQAKEYLLEFVQALGYDFPTGIKEYNRSLQEGEITQDQFNQSIAGWIELWKDELPDSIDTTRLTLRHLREDGTVDIKALTKDLDELNDMMNQISGAAQQGLSEAFDLLYPEPQSPEAERQAKAEERTQQINEQIRQKRVQDIRLEIDTARKFGDEVRAAELETEMMGLQAGTGEEAAKLDPQAAFMQRIRQVMRNIVVDTIIQSFLGSEGGIKAILAPFVQKVQEAGATIAAGGDPAAALAMISEGAGGVMPQVQAFAKLVIDAFNLPEMKSLMGMFDSPVAMAAGGIVKRPTFAMLGEAGPELVLPLRKALGEGASSDQALRALAGGGGQLLGGSVSVNVDLRNSTISDAATGREFARRVSDEILRTLQMNRPIGH